MGKCFVFSCDVCVASVSSVQKAIIEADIGSIGLLFGGTCVSVCGCIGLFLTAIVLPTSTFFYCNCLRIIQPL